MPSIYKIHQNNDSIDLMDSDNQIVASITKKPWETDFFNKKFGALNLKPGLEKMASVSMDNCLDEILSAADQDKYALIELVLETTRINLVPLLEEKSFRLVDTKISYMTLMNKNNLKAYHLNSGNLRFARSDDLPDILDLTHDTLTNNPNFFSRFKNPNYFTKEESKRYYAAWINNTLADKDTLFAVYEHNRKLAGFFIYKYSGVFENKPIFKGISTAVAPEYRGNKAHLAMQAFLYNQIQHNEFFVNNATQLSNYPVIMNHVRSQKK